MNPNYVHTITLYRKQDDGTWLRSLLSGCFWKASTFTTQTGTQAAVSNTYTVRIPLDVVGPGFRVSAGDLVVHGSVSDDISDAKGSRLAEILAKYKPEAFKVSAFSDNTAHFMDKHYRLGG